jgi:hypothetical protein
MLTFNWRPTTTPQKIHQQKLCFSDLDQLKAVVENIPSTKYICYSELSLADPSIEVSCRKHSLKKYVSVNLKKNHIYSKLLLKPIHQNY